MLMNHSPCTPHTPLDESRCLNTLCEHLSLSRWKQHDETLVEDVHFNELVYFLSFANADGNS